MRIREALGTLATLGLGASISVAGDLATGADLARACRDQERPGICINYLLNVADGHDAFATWGAIAHQWCMPQVTHQRLRAVYLKFLAAHPEAGAAPINEAVARAYAATYPCPKQE